MERACNRHRRDEKCIRILVGKPEGKSPPGKCEDNIKMYFRYIGQRMWTGFICLRIVTCSGPL
jgi:hypothetical protein